MMINPGMMPMPMNSMMINPINTNSMINIISLINSPIFIDAHIHPLILCLTKARANCGTTWKCNKCSGVFSYDIPSFYCSFCDFDLCKKCLENYNVGNVFVYNYSNNNMYLNSMNNPPNLFQWQVNLPCHNHALTLIQKENKNFSWSCKLCNNSYSNNESFFYCSLCDYILCQYCANKYPNTMNNINSQNIKVIFDYKGEKKEMTFNYGRSVSNALAEYKNLKSFGTFNQSSFEFIYKSSKINDLESQKVDEFFSKNEINYVIVMDSIFSFNPTLKVNNPHLLFG